MRLRARLACALALAFQIAVPTARAELPPGTGTLELHAHLFMKPGMGPLFRGDFFGPLRATSFRDKLSEQANPESLTASGISLVVATLYANPLLTTSLRGAIREELAQARRFVSENPGWIIAREPGEARAALESGKRVLVLALEGGSGILENENDLREFVDEGGIRIVTLLHLTDDAWGGVAFLSGFKALANPLAWLSRPFSGDARRNPEGLLPRGQAMLDKLVGRRVWIDLAHASDASLASVVPRLERARLPLLVSHTSLRRYHAAERGISDELLARVRGSGGIVGLVPSPEFLDGTDRLEGACALARQWNETIAALGDARRVALGSDWNGGIEHLRGPAAECVTGTSLDGPKGLWNIGQSSEIWKAMQARGVSLPTQPSQTIETFLDAWARVRAL